MGQNTATDQKHRGGSSNGESLHQPGGQPQNAPTHTAAQHAARLAQVQARVVQLDDAGHQAINTHRHHDGDGTEDKNLGRKVLALHRAQRDGDDFSRQNEVSANRTLDLVFFQRQQIHLRLTCGGGQRLAFFGLFIFAVHELVRQFLKTLETQKRPTHHQQRCHGPRGERTDGQGGGNQYRLVDEGAFGDGPHHGQLPVSLDARHLLRVERQVIAQHPSGFFSGNFRQHCHVVQDGGNVV